MAGTEEAVVDVHVEVPPAEPAEVITPEPTSDPEVHVHNETPTVDPGIHPTLATFMQDVTRELQELRGRTEHAETTAGTAHTVATGAQGAVDSAVGDVQSIAEELSNTSTEDIVPQIPSTPELDSDPHKPHLWFRPVRRRPRR